MSFIGRIPANAALTASDLADDVITLAKIAGGTDGNIISYDASGDPVAVATGSDGQVLTSTGAGSPPVFETLSAELNTPSFYGQGAAATAIANATLTKIAARTEIFDNGGCYNNTGSSATLNSLTAPADCFTPNVAGLYYFVGAIKLNTANFNVGLVNNIGGVGGSETYAALAYGTGIANDTIIVSGYSLMNGSGNNVCLTGSQESGGSVSTNDAIYTTYFGGFLVKKS